MGIWGLEAEEGFLLRQEGLLGGGREGDVEARRARWSEAKRKERAWLGFSRYFVNPSFQMEVFLFFSIGKKIHFTP